MLHTRQVHQELIRGNSKCYSNSKCSNRGCCNKAWADPNLFN